MKFYNNIKDDWMIEDIKDCCTSLGTHDITSVLGIDRTFNLTSGKYISTYRLLYLSRSALNNLF